jgi:hypothetical protein
VGNTIICPASSLNNAHTTDKEERSITECLGWTIFAVGRSLRTSMAMRRKFSFKASFYESRFYVKAKERVH